MPTISLKIGYVLIFSNNFDYGNTISQFLIARKSDESNVIGYTRFLQLIFNHLCRDTVFEDDELLPIFKIAYKEIKDHLTEIRKRMLMFSMMSGSFLERISLLLRVEQILMLFPLLPVMLWNRAKHTLLPTKASLSKRNPNTQQNLIPPLMLLK